MNEANLVALADACQPALVRTTVRPKSLVRVVADAAAFQGWRCEKVAEPQSIACQLLGRGASFILDFGAHTVGQLQLRIAPEPAADAPVRLKLTFAEVPAELGESFDPYDHSNNALSRSWLQDEIVNIDIVPQTVILPRRYAFRYVKIEIIDTAPAYKIRFADISCITCSSADASRVAPLPATVPEDVRVIDEVALRTLHNCMQTVFEDGPKRDRRLWLGDLRLQALANYVSFRNYDLVKRCLLLFGGLCAQDGLVNADMYEFPTPHRGNCRILDYSALFAATVLDYLQASGDRETAQLLWPIALRQLELLKYVNADDVFVDPGNWWIFIDWHSGLHRSAASHGVLLYGMQQTYELSRLLGREGEVASLPAKIEAMRQAARHQLFDSQQGVFVSGPQRQVSWASQAWLTLGGVLSADEGSAVLSRAMANPQAVRPNGPYLYHHVVHAMLLCGMKQQATELIRHYWGTMVELGATTFWEVFDPANQKLSPYNNNHLMNSYCHAWSCTPTWFIRQWLAK